MGSLRIWREVFINGCKLIDFSVFNGSTNYQDNCMLERALGCFA